MKSLAGDRSRWLLAGQVPRETSIRGLRATTPRRNGARAPGKTNMHAVPPANGDRRISF